MVTGALPTSDRIWHPPGPRADDDIPASAHHLFDPSVWRSAQRDHAGELAFLTEAMGQLDERLRSGPAGWRHRCALQEAAALSWWAGDRIGADRLALWLGARLSGVGDDARALARAGWAARRLGATTDPRRAAAAFFGRTGGDDAMAADLEEALAGTDGLHPAVAAARLFPLWRQRGSGRPGDDIEAAVLAMRVARPVSGGAVAGLGFLPLAHPTPGALTQSGPVAARLAAWLQGATRATRAALAETDRLRNWEATARARLGPRPGATLDAILRTAGHWPTLSVQLVEAQTGASRATAARHLARLDEAGLIREITGQSRYRAWRITTRD